MTKSSMRLVIFLFCLVLVSLVVQSQDIIPTIETPTFTPEFLVGSETPTPLPSQTATETVSPIITETSILFATFTETPTITETATETPILETATVWVTETATDQETEITETPIAFETETSTATETSTLTLLFSDDFEEIGTDTWSFGIGWAYHDLPGNKVLRVYNSDGPISPNINPTTDVVLETDVISTDSTVFLAIRSNLTEQYAFSLSPDGEVRLWRNDIILSVGRVSVPLPDTLTRLRVEALGNTLSGYVNDQLILSVSDTNPLGEGQVKIYAQFTPLEGDITPIPPQNTVIVDNVSVYGIVAIPVTETVMPTITPTLLLTETSTTTPTLAPTLDILPPDPELSLLLRETFDDNELPEWTIGNGWSLVTDDSGQILQAVGESQNASLNQNDLYNVRAIASVLWSQGTAKISVRESLAGAYRAEFSNNGQVDLYKGDTLLTSTLIAATTEIVWHTLSISAFEDVLRVSVDGVEVIAIRDTSPLQAGSVSFNTANLGETQLSLDNVEVYLPLADMPLLEEPELALLFTDNFNDLNTSNWLSPMEVDLTITDEGYAFPVIANLEPTILESFTLSNVVWQSKILLTEGSLAVKLRETPTDGYSVILYSDGRIDLYRNAVVVKSAQVDLFDATIWHELRFSVLEDVLRISVDDQQLIAIRDTNQLPTGSISLRAESSTVNPLIDDVELWVPLSELPPPQLVAEPALMMFNEDNFDDVGFRSWMENTGWTFGFTSSSQSIETRINDESALFFNDSLTDVVIETEVYVNLGKAMLIARSTTESSYELEYDPTGTVKLYRSGELVGATTIPYSGLWNWRAVRMSVIENTIRVAVDGIEVLTYADRNPLPPGQVAIKAFMPGDDSQALLSLDKVTIFVPLDSVNATTGSESQYSKLPARSILSTEGVPMLAAYQGSPTLTQGRLVDVIAYSLWAGVSSPGQGPREEIYLQGVNSNSMAQVPFITNLNSMEVYGSISPDGTRIAFSSSKISVEANQTEETFDIYIVDILQDSNGNYIPSAWKRLTNNSLARNTLNLQITNINPVWSPDGTRIAFQSNRGGVWQIYVMNAFDKYDVTSTNVQDYEGDNLYALNIPQTTITKWEIDPTWSPDGRWIAYAAGGCDVNGDYNIYRASPYRQIAAQICQDSLIANTIGSNISPDWSPDGRYIIFTGYREGSIDPDIYIRSSNAQLKTQFLRRYLSESGSTDEISSVPVELNLSTDTTPWTRSTEGVWSPDQSSIAFTADIAANGAGSGLGRRVYILQNISITLEQAGSFEPLVIAVSFNNDWSSYPRTSSTIRLTWNGPSWSKFKSCYGDEINSQFTGRGSDLRRRGLQSRLTDPSLARSCLYEYLGPVFYAYQNETSNGSFDSLSDIQFPQFQTTNVLNHRYLYARVQVNGIINNAEVSNEYGVGYFNRFSFYPRVEEIFLGGVTPPLNDKGIPLIQDPRAAWITSKLNLIFINQFSNSEIQTNSLQDFLPYFNTVVFDMVYGPDPYASLSNIYDMLHLSICSSFRKDGTCDGDQFVPIALVNSELPSEIASGYQCHLNDPNIMNYRPSFVENGGGARRETVYVRVVIRDLAIPNRYVNWLTAVFQDPKVSGSYLWAGIGIEPIFEITECNIAEN